MADANAPGKPPRSGSTHSLLAGIDLRTASVTELLNAVKPRLANGAPSSQSQTPVAENLTDETDTADELAFQESAEYNSGQGQGDSEVRSVAKLLADRWQELPADRKQAVFRKQLIQEREFFMKKTEQVEQENADLKQRMEELEQTHADEMTQQESTFQTELQTLREKLEFMSEELAKTQHEHDEELKEIHHRSSGLITDKDAELNHARTELELVQQQNAQLTTVLQQMESDYREERSRLTAQLDLLNREKKMLEADNGDLLQKLQDSEARGGGEKKDGEKKGDFHNNAKRVADDLNELKETSSALKSLLNNFRNQDEKAVREMENRMKHLESKVKELEEDSNRMTKFVQDLEAQLKNPSQMTQSQRDELEHQLAETRRRLAETEAELTNKRADWKMQEAQLLQAKSYLEQRSQLMNESMAKLVSQLEALEERCGSLAAENADLRAAMNTVKTEHTHRTFGVNTELTFPLQSLVPVDRSAVWRRASNVEADDVAEATDSRNRSPTNTSTTSANDQAKVRGRPATASAAIRRSKSRTNDDKRWKF